MTRADEMWTVLNADVNAFRCFEREILRQIYGPVYNVNVWWPRKVEKLRI